MRSCSSNSLQATSATYGSKQIWETTTVVTSKSRNGGFLIYCIILSLVNHDKIVTLFWQNTQSFFWAEKVALPPVLFGCLVVKSLKKKRKKKERNKQLSHKVLLCGVLFRRVQYLCQLWYTVKTKWKRQTWKEHIHELAVCRTWMGRKHKQVNLFYFEGCHQRTHVKHQMGRKNLLVRTFFSFLFFFIVVIIQLLASFPLHF